MAPHKCEQARAGGGSRVPIRRPVCGSHHRCHLQLQPPGGPLSSSLPSSKPLRSVRWTRGVRRCRPPCLASFLSCSWKHRWGWSRSVSNVGPKPQCSLHHPQPPPPRPYPPLRLPSPSELHPCGGSTSASPRDTPAQPEDGRAGPTAILYLGFKPFLLPSQYKLPAPWRKGTHFH